MKALIVVASRHGATRGIADALAEELRQYGHTADVTTTTDAPALASYDAVVIGSAVYLGQWLKEASQFLQRNQEALLKLPVWLFSSGPVGPTTPDAKDDPPAIAQLMKQVGARGHRTFLGKLDPTHLGVGERFIMWNVKRLAPDAAHDGDFRDWAAIRAWADEISATLPTVTATKGALGSTLV